MSYTESPFGLSNTPSYFQRLMNDILHNHIAAGYCVCYCDDLLICTESDDPAEHLVKLTAVLDTLREHDLVVKGSKTEQRSNSWDLHSQHRDAHPLNLSGSSCGLACTRNSKTPPFFRMNSKNFPHFHSILF